MKRRLLSVLSILICLSSKSQFPSLSQHITSGISTVEFWYENCFLNSSCYEKKDKVKAEVPPWVIGGGWRSYFMVDGTYTYVWSTPKSLIDNSAIDFKNDAVGPETVSLPYSKSSYFSPTSNIENWKRNYHSVYSAHYIPNTSQGAVSIGIMHGENKNVSDNCTSGNIQNTINPHSAINCSDHDTWSGGNPYQDGWLAYHAMISVSWTFNNLSTNWGQQYFSSQLGPVTWPANGFIAPDNRIATCGHSHPSSILDNGYMYIFYSDAGPWGDHMPQEEGRLRGIKVLRVLQTESLDPGKYQVYYKDPAGNVSWSSSLPAGFNKDNMLQYVRVKGPKSTDVLNNNSNSAVIRFSVAKVKNTSYYIGIEEYMDLTDVCSPGVSKYKLALRFSSDLVNWSDRKMHVTAPKCWDQHNMRYPIFLDKTGWTNTEVDLDDFYILGTAGINKSVNKLRVYKYVAPPPPPPPCPPHHQCNPAFAANLSKNSKEPNLELARENISIFPNPVQDYLNINVVTNSRISFQVEIYDSNGRLVKATNSELLQIGTNQRRISVSGMTKGIYFVRINKNNKSVFSKFVIL